jgi:predicted dehydrogenase
MDAAAHQFDMLRNLAASDCAQIATLEWNPPRSSSTGQFCAVCLLRMANGVPATYEGNATAAGEQNSWRQEYYRAECEDGSVTVGSDQVVRIHRHTRGRGVVTEEVPAPPPPREGHAWIVAAMVFGAIEAARTGQWVDVAQMVNDVFAATSRGTVP